MTTAAKPLTAVDAAAVSTANRLTGCDVCTADVLLGVYEVSRGKTV